MIISCNECDSSFSVDDSLIKDTGSKVRCSKCNSVFTAYPQPLETDEGEDLSLEGLDASLANLEEDNESIESKGLLDELELDLDDFDDTRGEDAGLEPEGLADDTDGELELDISLDDDDGSDLDMSDKADAGDELPDLDDFEDLAGLDDDSLLMDDTEAGLEDLAGLDDDSLLMDDTEAGLEDLNLDSEAETDDDEAPGVNDLELEGDEEFNLSDLDLDDTDEAELETEAATDSEDLDLGLDLGLDDDAPVDEEIAEAGLEIEDVDELDLSDLELELNDASASDDTMTAASDDLDFDLEEEAPREAEIADAGEEIEDADELDLSDLGLEMEDASASDDAAAAGSDDLNLDLDLEEEAEAIAGGEETAADELDLSDLEEIIGSDEAPGDQPAGQDAAEDLELDFDLEIDEVAQTADTGEKAEADVDELDLQFDIDDQPAGGADALAAADVGEPAQDNDLLDIEQMLEQSDDMMPDMEGEEEDLSLTMEVALDDAAQSTEADLDFDIESELQEKEDIFDSGESTDDQLESNLLDSEDVDFLSATGIQDDSQPVDVGTDEFATDAFSDEADGYGHTDVSPDSDDDVPGPPAKAKPAKSRSKKPVFAVLVFLILAIGVLIIPKSLGIKIPYISDLKIPYLSDLDIKIPYLSDWLNPQAQDVVGNLKIIPLGRTISAEFVNNSKVGRLFVIRGKIKNDYNHPRSYVKVTGKLYKKGQKLAKSATVYCGNVIPESELTKLDIATINKRMKNKFGNKKSNLKIKTGKIVPFMIVFDKLPSNLDEYTVEVVSSSI
jgi:pilus assembly protein FimV